MNEHERIWFTKSLSYDDLGYEDREEQMKSSSKPTFLHLSSQGMHTKESLGLAEKRGWTMRIRVKVKEPRFSLAGILLAFGHQLDAKF